MLFCIEIEGREVKSSVVDEFVRITELLSTMLVEPLTVESISYIVPLLEGTPVHEP